MLKKSFDTLKKNPLILIIYLLAMAVVFLSVFLFLPEVNKITDFSYEITKNQTDLNAIDPQKMTVFVYAVLKLLLFGLLAFIFGILFMAGFGNILAEAAGNGKTYIKSFFSGIMDNFKKTILSFLLFIVFSIGFGIFMAFVSIFFTVFSIVQNNFNTQIVYDNQRIIQALSNIIMIFIYPMVELWLPAIFTDKNEGVIVSLKKGFKEGIKNYKQLVVLTAILFLPSIGLLVFNNDINIAALSPAYIAVYIYQIIVMPFIITYLFTLYNEKKLIQQRIE